MAAKQKKTVLGTSFTILIIAAVLWMNYDEVRDGQLRDGQLRDENVIIPEPSAVGPSGSQTAGPRNNPWQTACGQPFIDALPSMEKLQLDRSSR